MSACQATAFQRSPKATGSSSTHTLPPNYSLYKITTDTFSQYDSLIYLLSSLTRTHTQRGLEREVLTSAT